MPVSSREPQLTPAKPLPLFLRLAELLARSIAAGHYLAGERLPPESELSETLGAAIGTVRKALAILEERGLLERKQGSGTYVLDRAAAKPNQPAPSRNIYDFFRLELTSGGGLPSALLIQLKKARPPKALPTLGDESSDRYYRLRRLRFLNETPVALEEIWFDAQHCPQLRMEELDESLYHFYETRLGFWISHAEDRFSLGIVPDWAPVQFSLKAGHSCCIIERKAWCGNGTIEEFSKTWVDTRLANYVARWS